MLTRHFGIFLALILPIVIFCQPASTLDQENWVEDFEYLKEKLPKSHINLYHSIDEENFVGKLDTIIRNTKDWSYSKSYVEISRLLANIGDGHTFARVPKEFHRFPMKWFWFNDGVRLIKSDFENKELLGFKLVSIDNVGLNEIKNKLFEMSTDNEGELHQYFFSSYFLNIPEVLFGLGITNNKEVAEFEFEDFAGNRIKKSIKSTKLSTYITSTQVSAYDPIPLYLNSTEPISIHELNNSTLYINFQEYPKSIRKISKKIKGVIKRKKIKKLIVDFRNNTGGNFNKGLYLIKEIKKTGFHKTGKTYVLIGRSTISAAMSNTCHFKQQMDAVLVGEPTGSRPIGYQENDEFELPNSKFEISYSTKFYSFQEEDTKGVIPDKKINPSFEDFRRGEDNALNWIINQNK